MSTYHVSRRVTRTNTSSWSRNSNFVRANQNSVGLISRTMLSFAVVILLGLFFVSNSSSVTDFDVEIAEKNSELSELEAQRDALAVENAKLTAVASDPDLNTVASAMVDANSADFVRE